MKKILIFCSFSVLLVISLLLLKKAQVHEVLSPNDYIYNLNDVGSIEKLFFGDIPSPIEFIYFPPHEGASAARVKSNFSNSSYILEVKYVSNYSEAADEARRRYPSIALWDPSDVTDDIVQHNREVFARQRERKLQLFEVETLSFPISSLLVEKLHANIATFINNYEEKNSFPDDSADSVCPETGAEYTQLRISVGGDAVLFRILVDDEIHSLRIHNPENRALEFSNLFRQMIEDAIAGEFDEERYMEFLSAM